MLSLLLLAQTSLLTRPMYMDQPPELRSAQHILIAHEEVPEAPSTVTLTREEAEALGARLLEELKDGADFVELAFQHSMARSGTRGAVLGTFAPGMLPEVYDDFLFHSRIGDVSGVLSTTTGVHILRRVETRAAVLQIFVEGVGLEARARCTELKRRLAAGEQFGDLARDLSDDAESGGRGGQFAIFERGANDRLLKQAAFELEVGEVSEPIESPLGLHIIKRVPLSAVDPSLAESKWIRARGLLVAYSEAVGADPLIQRSLLEAKEMADELYSRIRSGETLTRLASQVNDDPGGRERAGDLGWIHREAPDLPVFMERLFTKPIGEVQPPVRTTAGWAILVREK